VESNGCFYPVLVGPRYFVVQLNLLFFCSLCVCVYIYIYIMGIEAKEMENWFIHQNHRSLIDRIINYLS